MLGQHLHRYKSLANGPGAFFLVTASTIMCLDSCSSFLSVSPMPFLNVWLPDYYFFNTGLVLSFYIWLPNNLPVIELEGT